MPNGHTGVLASAHGKSWLVGGMRHRVCIRVQQVGQSVAICDEVGDEEFHLDAARSEGAGDWLVRSFRRNRAARPWSGIASHVTGI